MNRENKQNQGSSGFGLFSGPTFYNRDNSFPWSNPGDCALIREQNTRIILTCFWNENVWVSERARARARERNPSDAMTKGSYYFTIHQGLPLWITRAADRLIQLLSARRTLATLFTSPQSRGCLDMRHCISIDWLMARRATVSNCRCLHVGCERLSEKRMPQTPNLPLWLKTLLQLQCFVFRPG